MDDEARPMKTEQDEREERRRQMALAAERRIAQAKASENKPSECPSTASDTQGWRPISEKEMKACIKLIFGGTSINPGVLQQWTSQGLQLSKEKENFLILQNQGGPCGVLAPVQAFLLKHLIFSSSFSGTLGDIAIEDIRRAMKGALGEALWRAGNYESASLVKPASEDAIHAFHESIQVHKENCSVDDLCTLFINLFIKKTCRNRLEVLAEIEHSLESIETSVGVVMTLFSIVFSRGIEAIQGDQDDPGQPLITSPFGHASQEVVNLFLTGKAVSNVFNGNLEMEGSITLKGITGKAQVGFLTLLESLNYMKVGSHLKEPEYPIWVLGSESHYTVLFSLNRGVQELDRVATREKHIRQVFDEHDQSGGGGFIDQAGLQKVLDKVKVHENVAREFQAYDVITWQELWSKIKKSEFPEEEGNAKPKVLDLYHVNGIAKAFGSDVPKPVLKVLTVKLTMPLESWAGFEDANVVPLFEETKDKVQAQWCPLVDCIRTRWKEAECHWQGDAPSMV